MSEASFQVSTPEFRVTPAVNPIEQLAQGQRVIIMIGAGGVGKTTSAIAIATLAAIMGKRVALLSIDPAKRLAAALGIPLGHELAPVTLPAIAQAQGSLYAAMLDQKAVFDSMVRKHAPSPHIADRILRDPLYVAAASNLSGPLEYMALARLQELADDPAWDLVVLDTPPDTHALDFLARPNVLSGFLESKVISTLLKPVVAAGKLGLGGLAAVSERLVGGVSSVTGFAALRKLGEFILLMQEVIEGFHAAGERVLEILRRPSSSFILVTVPTKAATRGAIYLGEQLGELGYKLDGIVLNRCLPQAVAQALNTDISRDVLILQTRRQGELACEQQLAARLSARRGKAGLWRCRMDEMSREMMSIEGILAFVSDLRQLSRFGQT